jgi:hypothetical protein
MGAEEEVDVESVSAIPNPSLSFQLPFLVACSLPRLFIEATSERRNSVAVERCRLLRTPENSCVPASTTVNAPFYFALRWAG